MLRGLSNADVPAARATTLARMCVKRMMLYVCSRMVDFVCLDSSILSIVKNGVLNWFKLASFGSLRRLCGSLEDKPISLDIPSQTLAEVRLGG